MMFVVEDFEKNNEQPVKKAASDDLLLTACAFRLTYI